jgi:hypothetical protein
LAAAVLADLVVEEAEAAVVVLLGSVFGDLCLLIWYLTH